MSKKYKKDQFVSIVDQHQEVAHLTASQLGSLAASGAVSELDVEVGLRESLRASGLVIGGPTADDARRARLRAERDALWPKWAH